MNLSVAADSCRGARDSCSGAIEYKCQIGRVIEGTVVNALIDFEPMYKHVKYRQIDVQIKAASCTDHNAPDKGYFQQLRYAT